MNECKGIHIRLLAGQSGDPCTFRGGEYFTLHPKVVFLLVPVCCHSSASIRLRTLFGQLIFKQVSKFFQTFPFCYNFSHSLEHGITSFQTTFGESPRLRNPVISSL